MLGLCCRVWAFSSCNEQGLLFAVVCRLPIKVASLVGAQALGHTGFSGYGSWPLESWLSNCGALGLVAPEHVGSSWARDWTNVPYIARQIPNQWTTREALFFWSFFFFNILSFMNCLHVLEINPFSVALVANIFSHSEGCLFIVFMVAFAVQKLLSFIKSHLFIFVLIFITLRGRSKQILLWLMSKNGLPVFSSEFYSVLMGHWKSMTFYPEKVCVYV